MRDDLRWTLAEAGAISTANGLGYLVGAVATAAVVRRSRTAARSLPLGHGRHRVGPGRHSRRRRLRGAAGTTIHYVQIGSLAGTEAALPATSP
jgi:hypothetical protein